MVQKDFLPGKLLKGILATLLLINTSFPEVQAQTIMFDDFTYTGVNDPQLSTFNKWDIVDGQSGPPEGAMYSKNNIAFVADPNNATNKLMTLSTTVDGVTKATTHSRIESSYEYFEGTYAARVYITDQANVTKDANIQTFFTIVPSSLAGDGSQYSELDIVEYMAADKWGVSPDNPVLYTTSYHKYIANPWQAWKTYFASKKSWAGWHTFIASCTDGVNVKYWIDDTYLGSQSVTDAETQAGLSVYPRRNMQVAFANWIWNNVVGNSTANRTNTMQADWTLFYKSQELSLTQINTLVSGYRTQGLQRRNLAGQTYITASTNQAPNVSLTAPTNNTTYTAPASITISANASDADGTISKVEFYNGATLLNSDATSPYSFAWTNVAAGTYSITAKATDNLGATKTSAVATVIVNPVTVTQSPYGGTAANIPGTVQAENYDLGGQAIAFNDITAANEGAAYRADGVDIEAISSGQHNVGWTAAGEWLEYTVNVTAGTYKIDARVAATATGKSFRIEMNGSTVATFNVPNTTGWQTWQTVTVNNVALTAGQKVMRIYCITDGFNIDNLIFTTATTPNQLPTVSLTAPTNNATFTAPASITIAANAADADGTISKVEFFNGTTLLNSDVTAPYSFAWTNVTTGTYNITTKATDNLGATTTSASVSAVVNPVTVTQSPYGGTAANIPGTVQAENYDLGGQAIAFNDATATNEGAAYRTDAVDIEVISANEFNVGWTAAGEWLEYTVNVIAGTYKIDARVAATATGKSFRIEMDGATIAAFNVPNTTGWQTWQTVTVNNVALTAGQKVMRVYCITDGFNIDNLIFTSVSNPPVNITPTVSITAPTNNATYTAPASITISANASDADGTISKVEFFNGTTLLNSDATAPYSFAWTNVAAGTYSITAKATDNAGATKTSSTTNVTVIASADCYQLVWSDEFDLPTLNTNNWNVEVNNLGGGNNELQYYTNRTENVRIENGNLVLEARKENYLGKEYTSGRLNSASKKSWQYGKMEAKMKLPYGNGMWPAFWMMGNTGEWPACGEIDIMEMVGGNKCGSECGDNKTHGYAWWSDGGDKTLGTQAPTLASGKYADEYHVFGIEWNATSIQWFIDGNPFYSLNTSPAAMSEFQQSFYLLLNLAVGGDWPGSPDASTVFPQKMMVDYVRVFQKTGSGCTNQMPTVSITAPTNNATYTAPASITISANASDADGTISKVEFFNGTTLLNSDATAPYSFYWTNVAAGTYSITAKATDNAGATKTSALIVIVNAVTTGGCTGIAQYVENGGYGPDSKVQNAGSQYQCKPYPYSGWCNGAAWAYAPGTGAYSADAWTLIGSCSARISDNNTTATVNDNLLTNTPNPFTYNTDIEVTLAESGEVSIVVVDKTGQVVATILEGSLASGTHHFNLDSTPLNPGMYIVKCNSNSGVITRKIIKAQ